MRKNLILISCCLALCGCPPYDPPSGLLEVHNYSDTAVYVYSTCEDMLPCNPPLLLFQTMGENSFDAKGNKMMDTISPSYRINAFTFGTIGVSGTSEKPRLPCDNERIRLFFIKELVMREKSWEEICKNQLYVKKVVLSREQLNELGWLVTYIDK